MRKKMKNRVYYIYLSWFFIIILFYVSVFILQNYAFKYKYDFLTKQVLTPEEFKNYTYDYVRCNLNIFNPELVVISTDYDPILTFHSIPILPFYEINEPLDFYTGSTRIYNLSFSQALQMLKKDCNQFKKNYNWSNRKKETAWIYYPKDNETYDNTETVDFDQYLQEKLNSFKTEKEREEFLEKFKKEKSTKPDLETFLEVIDSIKEN